MVLLLPTNLFIELLGIEEGGNNGCCAASHTQDVPVQPTLRARPLLRVSLEAAISSFLNQVCHPCTAKVGPESTSFLTHRTVPRRCSRVGCCPKFLKSLATDWLTGCKFASGDLFPGARLHGLEQTAKCSVSGFMPTSAPKLWDQSSSNNLMPLLR